MILKKSSERYQNLMEEEKNEKQKYGGEQYKNLSENKKQRLAEYRKTYYKMPKNINKVA